MTRKDFLRLCGAALAPALGLPVRGQSARPKNVLLLMSDQHRRDCLGIERNALLRTPNWMRSPGRACDSVAHLLQPGVRPSVVADRALHAPSPGMSNCAYRKPGSVKNASELIWGVYRDSQTDAIV